MCPQGAAGSEKAHNPLPHLLPGEPNLDFVVAPMRGSALRALLVLSCLLPFLVLAMAGARSWQFERSETAERATATLGILEEHVRKVLDTQVLVLDWLSDRVEGLSWEEIERSRSLYELLAFLDKNYAQIDGIFLIDATGRVRINSHQFPLERTVELADRDYFRALSAGRVPLFISAPYAGRWNGAVSFRVARPLLTSDGAFRGVVALSLHVDYFERAFKSAVNSTGRAVTLMRDDGQVLVRFPQTAPTPTVEDWQRAAPQGTDGVPEIHPSIAMVDGVAWLTAVRVVAGYPIALIYRVPQSVIFAAWYRDFTLYGIVALISAGVLSTMTYIAIRGEQRTARAIAAWQREQLQRLEAEADARRLSKYEALGTLAGGVAHHFNNLLPALTGHLEIAMEEVGAGSAAQPRLRRLSQEVAGARKIVRDILLFSRREITGFRPIDLGIVAAESVELFRAGIAKTAELETDIAQEIPVLGDPVQLSQLISNLLSNAYDALDSGTGTIVLAVGTAPVAETSEGSLRYARLVCRDTGAGMSAEVLERAFDPFFTTKPPGSGSGLGLAICDGIIRSHGGRISVESAVGRGTAVTVLLPLARGEGG
jgi:two-component system, NtrC family, sensor kinase